MSDPNIEVKFTARTDGVEQGATDATKLIQNAVSQMRDQFAALGDAVKNVQSQIEGMFSGLQAGFAQFNNVMFAVQNAIAGGSMFKEFVSSSMETTKEAVALGKAFGITATEGSYLRAAAAGVGVSFDTLQAAGTRLTRTILTNEDGIKSLGVSTRDAQGHFRSTSDVMQDVNARLRDFKEGTDRNVEGMKIYGREWANIAPLVSKFKGVTEESRQEAEALNLVVGQEAVSAMADYKTAQLGVGEVMEGIKNTIGQALMPGLTDMANWFRSVGPQVIEITRGAMQTWLVVVDNAKQSVKVLWDTLSGFVVDAYKGIMSVFGLDSEPMTGMQFVENVLKVVQVAFIGLRVGIEEACEFIKGYILALMQDFRTFADVAVAALHFDWSGVKQAWKEGTAAAEKIMQDSMNRMVQIASKGREDIDKAIASKPMAAPKVTPIQMKEGGERSDGKDDKDKKSDSQIGKWSAELKAAKDTYELENGLKQRDLADDLTYWQSKVALADAKNGDLAKVELKLAETKLAIMKRDVAQGRAMSEEAINDAEKAGLDSITLTKAEYDQKFQLGLISKSQMLAIEQDLESQKLEIQRSAQQARIAMVENDPNHTPAALQKEKDKLLEIERKYQQQITQLRTKSAVEDQAYANNFGKSLQQSFSSLLQKFAQGTVSLRGLLVGMGQAVLGSLTQIFADIAAKWLASQIMQRIGASITALGQVSANAAVAGAAAFASTAAIPIVGPALAPAAGAAAYAGAMSYAPMTAIPAAAKGYDIPAGVNPLTQLHEREMVLPQKQADAVRKMADSSDMGNAPMAVHFHGQQLRGGFWMLHQDDMVKALKDAGRKFKLNS